MTDYINIRRAAGNWVIRSEDAVVGESSNALELVEGDLPPVIYFPRADLAMALLEPTHTTTHCPHKGDAQYFSFVGPSGTLADVAWSYPAPIEAVAQLKDYVAFYAGRGLTVENLH